MGERRLLAYRGPVSPRPFAGWSLPVELARQATERPDATFLQWTDGGPATSFEAAEEIVRRLGHALRERGLAAEDRVALLLHNSLDHVWYWLAIIGIGAVDAPINPAYSGDLLAHQLELISPRLIIVDRDLVGLLESAPGSVARDCPRLLNDADETKRHGATIAGLLASVPNEVPPSAPADPTTTGSILYTSGTTGPSKGVRMPHAQAFFWALQTVDLHRMGPQDCYLAPYPLFHASARIHGVAAALVSGGRCVLYDKFSASDFARRVAASGATVTHFLGSMMKLIMDRPPGEHDRRSRLRSVMALPTPASLVDGFRARFGAENIVEVIGLTEACWPVMSPYGQSRPPGAAGLAVDDWYEVAVLDPETDLPVAEGVAGELALRPRAPWIVSAGYEAMPDKTVEAWRNLLFHTGDMVRRDAEGWFYFVDRLKDSIRRRGENISSYEVEQAALSFTGISDAAAVAIRLPGEERDEEIMLVVVGAGNGSPSWNALAAHLRERLPGFAVPRFVRAVTALPKTPSGKVRKAELRALGTGAGTVELMPQRRGRCPRPAKGREAL